MTQLAQPSPDTAPRDLQQLEKMGRFQLRKLAESLSIIVNNSEDPDHKANLVSFMGMNTSQQAQTVLTALQAHDQGGSAAPAPQVAQEQPAATVGAGGGLSNGTPAGGLQRTPVTKGATPAPAAQTGGSLDISPVMNALAGILESNKVILANQKELFNQIAALQSQLGVVTAVNLLVGESACNASAKEILDAAVGDVDAVLKQINEAVKGKAKTK